MKPMACSSSARKIAVWSSGRGLIGSRFDVCAYAMSQSGTGYCARRLWVMSG